MATSTKRRQTGAPSHPARDKARKAKAPGKRVSASGKAYTERRRNRSDADRRKRV